MSHYGCNEEQRQVSIELHKNENTKK